MNTMKQQRLLILDFGSQYTQLIARRIREMGVYSEPWSCESSLQDIIDFQPNGIILSGGPNSVFEAGAPQVKPEIFQLDIPVLGVCYGLQVVVQNHGGLVKPSAHSGEYGTAVLHTEQDHALFKSMPKSFNVWMSHGDQVAELPDAFDVLASTPHCPYAAVACSALNFYGLQFHPEVTHTEYGIALLKAFVFDICGCKALWQTEDIKQEAIAQLKEKVTEGRVLLGLSGGVDSSVTALLLHQAIGDRLQCVFVDHGLLRKDEALEVKALFEGKFGLQIDFVDAKYKFMHALSGVQDPEEKRKIIGRLFIETFEEHAQGLDDIQWLAQGTIYPDVIESAGQKHAQLIKSHHNVGGLPEDLSWKLVEPLRDLFKDEVRQLGLALGLPQEMIERHPFPGPGLGVRVVGEIKPEYCDILREADAIFIEELRRAKCYEQVAQAFAVFIPVKTVGVKGDDRAYDWVIGLRAVETTDFMTARWARLPYDLLDVISHRIMNEVREVSRVAYDISGKPPATIEWE